jgi:hypothetical protein
MRDMRNAYKIFVGEREGMILLGRPRHKWKGIIRMDLREVGQGSVN